MQITGLNVSSNLKTRIISNVAFTPSTSFNSMKCINVNQHSFVFFGEQGALLVQRAVRQSQNCGCSLRSVEQSSARFVLSANPIWVVQDQLNDAQVLIRSAKNLVAVVFPEGSKTNTVITLDIIKSVIQKIKVILNEATILICFVSKTNIQFTNKLLAFLPKLLFLQLKPAISTWNNELGKIQDTPTAIINFKNYLDLVESILLECSTDFKKVEKQINHEKPRTIYEYFGCLSLYRTYVWQQGEIVRKFIEITNQFPFLLGSETAFTRVGKLYSVRRVGEKQLNSLRYTEADFICTHLKGVLFLRAVVFFLKHFVHFATSLFTITP